MQRFTFPLERVLRHRERRERLAEMRLLRALGTLRVREQAAAALRARWQQAGAALPGRVNEPLEVTAWQAHFRHVERLARDMALADSAVGEAARAVEEAAAQRRQQAREAEALRQLRRRQHETYLEQAEKAEQRSLDEEGLRRWRQGNEIVSHGELL